MTKWKLDRYKGHDEVIELLKSYSKSLKECSENQLNVNLDSYLSNDKITYTFNILGINNPFNVKIFEITLIDLKSLIELNVSYFDGNKSFYLNINKLEKKIDSIIQSEKMGKYIRYLINIDSRKNHV
jgi:hypothetical protein